MLNMHIPLEKLDLKPEEHALSSNRNILATLCRPVYSQWVKIINTNRVMIELANGDHEASYLVY